MNEPQQFIQQGRAGPPVDGPRGTLAGIADAGDYLDVLNQGSYRNDGTKESPRWVKRVSDNPIVGARHLGA
jgi:hypothetical protein